MTYVLKGLMVLTLATPLLVRADSIYNVHVQLKPSFDRIGWIEDLGVPATDPIPADPTFQSPLSWDALITINGTDTSYSRDVWFSSSSGYVGMMNVSGAFSTSSNAANGILGVLQVYVDSGGLNYSNPVILFNFVSGAAGPLTAWGIEDSANGAYLVSATVSEANPEPASIGVSAVGLIALGLAFRFRRRTFRTHH